MPHIGFPDLIQHALDMVALSPHQCRQIQVIAVCDGVFSDGKPVVIVIFQDPLLGTAGKMSIADNMLICSKKGWKGLKISLNKKLREEFKEKLKILDMGLENRINENVEKLSGGQRQALTLLMAVMSKPSLLLLDEHTAALDPGNAEAVMKLTKEFAKEYNLTVMMITHNMNHALEYGNRLLMMDSGEIIMDISGKEKENLTMDVLIKRFKEIKKQELNSDAMLLG